MRWCWWRAGWVKKGGHPPLRVRPDTNCPVDWRCVMNALLSFEELYANALQSYLMGRGEMALKQAYELGRQAIDKQLGVLALAATYHGALSKVLVEPLHPAILQQASTFFAESLASFEMAQGGFREVIAQLRELNATLEERVAQQTQALRAANQTLEVTERAQRFLAEAGQLLAASLDYTTTLTNVAHLVVPQLADWCAIHIVEDKFLNSVVVAHADPSKEAWATARGEGTPRPMASDSWAKNVLQSGHSKLYTEVSDDLLATILPDPQHQAMLREMGVQSALLIPLIARERVLGVITLMWAEVGRHFELADLALAEELGRRAALAVDNARLYHTAQQLNMELEQRVLARTEEIQRTNAQLEQEIREHKRAEEQIRESEARLREAQHIARLGSWRWDMTTNAVFWSDETYRIYGLTPQSFPVSYESFLDRVHPEDRASVREAITQAYRDHQPFDFDHRIVLPSGAIRIIHAQGKVILDAAGQPQTMIGTGHDITAQKQIEARLRQSHEQLRALSAHLQSVREQERTRIAREIHDELGQVLAGLKMDATWLYNNLPGNVKARARLQTMLTLIDSTVQTVRQLITDLRPGILDDLGLAAAVEWQLQEFQAHTGLQCELTALVEDIDLAPDGATAVFRIFQETLTNIVRHAQATQVKVQLGADAGWLWLQVQDDGRGITEAELSGSKSFGLLGMRERVALLDGSISIDGAPGQGTTVLVKVPLTPPPQAPLIPSPIADDKAGTND